MNVWPLPHITFRELSTVRESRPTALLTDPTTWASINRLIELPLSIQAEPPNNQRDYLESLGNSLPSEVGVIYAIGDEHVLDAGKVVASTSQKPLIIIPTSFCNDTALTWTASVRDNNTSQEISTGPADEVIIDWDVIADAKASQRGAGIVEVLAIVTALLDWRLASQNNRTTPDTRLIPWAMTVAASLASQAIKSAQAVGQGKPEALRGLLDLMCMSVQLDSQLGHRRSSNGTEHIFADVVKAEPGVTHAEKVAAGILFASALHNQDVTPLRNALEQAGLRLDQLKIADLRAAANSITHYAREHNLPYGILNEPAADAQNMGGVLERTSLLPAPKVS